MPVEPRSEPGSRELWDYPRAGAPWRRGDRWFQLRNTGLQDQDVLWTADAPDAEGAVLFDPNAPERGGHDGSRLRRGLGERRARRPRPEPRRLRLASLARPPRRHRRGAAGPGRVEQVLVRRVDARRRRLLLRPLPGAAGRRRLRRAEPDMELRYHRLGTDSADDPLVFSTPARTGLGLRARGLRRRPASSSSRSGAAPTPRAGSTSPTSPSGVEGAVVRPLLDEADARYEHVATIDRTLYLLTDRDAPLGRVIAVDVDDPASIREVIPESDDALEQVRLVGDRLAVAYLHHAHGRLAIFELDGRHVTDVALPGHRHDRRDGRPPRRRRAVPDVRRPSSSPPIVLAVRMADGAVREVAAAGARVGPRRLRERAGVRHLGRRDARAALPDPSPRRRPGRRRPDAPPRLRRLPHPDRSGVQAGVAGLDGARRALRRRRRCAAEASTARRGTTPAASRTSRTSSTTSPRACGGWRRPAGRDRSGSRSAAARTAACSSARRSPSTRSCSARPSPRSA